MTRGDVSEPGEGSGVRGVRVQAEKEGLDWTRSKAAGAATKPPQGHRAADGEPVRRAGGERAGRLRLRDV